MNDMDKEIIIEDLEFIVDYVIDVLRKHPAILEEDPNFIARFDRRMNDILRRLGA